MFRYSFYFSKILKKHTVQSSSIQNQIHYSFLTQRKWKQCTSLEVEGMLLKLDFPFLNCFDSPKLHNELSIWKHMKIVLATHVCIQSNMYLLASTKSSENSLGKVFSTRCRKTRAESLVFSYIRVKKLRSTLKFWLEKLICIFFHSFHSWKKTANQLFSSKFQCRK